MRIILAMSSHIIALPTVELDRSRRAFQFLSDVNEAIEQRFAGMPARDVHLTAGFLSTMMRSNAPRRKVVAVAAEIAVGVADRLPGRQTHRLLGAGRRPVSLDGRPVMRSSLEANRPAARRLMWSADATGVLLLSARTHDNFKA